MAKMIYVVTGDQDGIIGVMGDKKKAIKLGQDYIASSIDNDWNGKIDTVVDDRDSVIYIDTDDLHYNIITIEKWPLGSCYSFGND